MHIHLPALIGMVVCYALVLCIGIWASRRREAAASTEDLYLAGRQLPLLVGFFTMTATWVGGGYINGTAEAVAHSGLVWCQAPWGYALSLFLGAFFFAGRMRDAGHTTFIDPFQKRYGDRVGALLFIPALVGEVFWSAAILTALGTTFGTILGLDTQTAIIVSATVAIAYTFLGGLWSVAYTDVAQLILIAVGLCVAIPFALTHVGGVQGVWDAYQARFGADASLLPPLRAFTGGREAWGGQGWAWLDMALLLVFGGIPWGVYFQRVLSCPSGAVARRLSVAAAVGCLVMAVPPAVIGAIGATVDWTATGAPGAPEGPMVLPYVLQYLTPSVVAIIGLGAVAAAVMSSVDSSVLSVSSMFVWNVYRPWAGADTTDRTLTHVTRASILVVGGLATYLALSVGSVYELWFFCSDLVYVILFPQLVMVIYDRRANARGAVAGLMVGALLRAGGGLPFLGIPAFIPYPLQSAEHGSLFPFRTTAMLSALATIWVVSRLTAVRPRARAMQSMNTAPSLGQG